MLLNGAMTSLLEFLDASPSPYHVVASAAADLDRAGFVAVDEREPFRDAVPGALRAGYLVRRGAIVAWRLPASGAPRAFRIVGAHTDSPGFRIHPAPDQRLANWASLGVEVYGGVLLNSWLDRDLGIAGEVVLASGERRLLNVTEPVARIPQLAIHLDREVNEGLRLDRHRQVRPVWATTAIGTFADWVGEHVDAPVSGWDLALADLQPAAHLGADRSLLASGRLDNQLSCWAGLRALIDADTATDEHGAVVALFDHEEVGSDSRTGAAGPLLADVLGRLLDAHEITGIDRQAAVLVASSCVSADNAHAVHPNYPERHDDNHAPLINHGPAIKLNVNQRYATDNETAALFARCADAAGVPWQRFVSRNDVPCGSTIGPLTATRLGIATVDVGVPQLSMHSARELCGADDPDHLRRALTTYLAGAEERRR